MTKKTLNSKYFKIFLCILILLCWACQEQEEPVAKTPIDQEKNFPDQESWESSVTITREGLKVAEVWAGYIAVYRNNYQSVFKDSIHVDFYNHAGRHYSVLTAKEGIMDNRTNNLKVFGNVVVVSDSGVILETQELKWDHQRQKIISDIEVKFTTEGDTLFGDSFISDPNLKEYEIRNARGYSKQILPLEK